MLTLRNTSPTKVIYVAGLSIAPFRKGTVNKQAYQVWLRQAAANRDTAARYLKVVPEKDPLPPRPIRARPKAAAARPAAAAVDPAAVRAQAIRAGFGKLTEKQYNKDGSPNLDAIRHVTGLDDISGDERDEHWRVHEQSARSVPTP